MDDTNEDARQLIKDLLQAGTHTLWSLSRASGVQYDVLYYFVAEAAVIDAVDVERIRLFLDRN